MERGFPSEQKGYKGSGSDPNPGTQNTLLVTPSSLGHDHGVFFSLHGITRHLFHLLHTPGYMHKALAFCAQTASPYKALYV